MGDAHKRLASRREMCKTFLDQENMFFIVHAMTPHVELKTGRFTPSGLAAALSELGVVSQVVVDRFVEATASGTLNTPLTYVELMSLLTCYFCGQEPAVPVAGAAAATAPGGGEASQPLPQWRQTVHACYRLFDPASADVGFIPLAGLKASKGKTGLRRMYTFPMHKALLDYCATNQIARLLTLEELENGWLSSPALALGFVEEVLRLILVDKYGGRRSELYPTVEEKP